jgi:hypothetical protein
MIHVTESMIVSIHRNIKNVPEAMIVSIYRMYQREWLIERLSCTVIMDK